MPVINGLKSTAVIGISLFAARVMLVALAYLAVSLESGNAVAQPPAQPPIQPPVSGASASGREAMWNTPTPTHYRILAKPTHPHSKSPIFTPEVPLPKIESQSVQPYAYGWFGARTLPNASRHFGYRSTYTQWTIK